MLDLNVAICISSTILSYQKSKMIFFFGHRTLMFSVLFIYSNLNESQSGDRRIHPTISKLSLTMGDVYHSGIYIWETPFLFMFHKFESHYTWTGALSTVMKTPVAHGHLSSTFCPLLLYITSIIIWGKYPFGTYDDGKTVNTFETWINHESRWWATN